MADVSVWRVLDVNSNRAAEGLRTIEDIARLVIEDSVASLWAKTLRHELATVVGKLSRLQRLSARSVETDAGTENSNAGEVDRADWRAIVRAACERVTQSLRCLEEFSKLVDAGVAGEFKSLRYQAYDSLAQLELRMMRDPSLKRAMIYLLVDCSAPIDTFTAAIRKFAEAGVDLFQIRDKACDGGKLVQYSRAAILALKDNKAKVIINDRIDVALASAAAGVHLGQEDMALRDARRILGPDFWIGVSTHNIEQAVQAEHDGADYIGCGPTFPTTTKSFTDFPGLHFLSEVAAHISIPAFAIGGIGLGNCEHVLATGISRIAVSSAIHQSPNPAATLREIKHRMQLS